MKVVHVSVRDITGGASRAAFRLHRGLRGVGVNSCVFVREKESQNSCVVEYEPSRSVGSRFRRLLRFAYMRSTFIPRYMWWPRGRGPISDDRSRFAGELLDQIPTADIVHLHFVAEFVDIPSFFREVDVPIVWTLHDMNPFTGGCHYDFGCGRFKESCGFCPHLDSKKENDPSRNIWKRKSRAFEKKIRTNRLHIVSPSEWLASEAESSSLLGNVPIHQIPHGLDDSLFRPRDADEQRSKLGIPSERKVVLFIAHSTTEPRKGFDLLVDALTEAALKGVTLLSIGHHRPSVPEDFPHVHVGHVDDDRRLSSLYSLADVFVIPSRQEAFGQTALESMACGTPVVGFNAGGIPDMVRPGKTGWLAERGDVRSLREALETALENNSARERMGRRCRKIVEQEYTLKNQAQEYMSVYNDIRK